MNSESLLGHISGCFRACELHPCSNQSLRDFPCVNSFSEQLHPHSEQRSAVSDARLYRLQSSDIWGLTSSPRYPKAQYRQRQPAQHPVSSPPWVTSLDCSALLRTRVGCWPSLETRNGQVSPVSWPVESHSMAKLTCGTGQRHGKVILSLLAFSCCPSSYSFGSCSPAFPTNSNVNQSQTRSTSLISILAKTRCLMLERLTQVRAKLRENRRTQLIHAQVPCWLR